MTGVLDLGIELDVWPWVWIGLAVIIALVELTLLAGSFVVLPFAVSAFAAALAGFYDASVEVQWGIFVFGGAALWWVFWKNVKRFTDDNTLGEGVGAGRLVGMTAIVTADIDSDDTERAGRVKVAGEVWSATAEGGTVLRAGPKVRITAVRGTRVLVEPIRIEPPTTPPIAPPVAPPPRDPTSPRSSENP